MTAPCAQTYRPPLRADDQDDQPVFGPATFINDQPRGLSSYKNSLMLRGHADAKFDQLNAHLRYGLNVSPGELIIIGDHSTSLCTPMERQLMSYAQEVHQALKPSNHASADVLVQNYDFLQNVMTYGSIGIGSSSSGWATHLNGVETTLKDINSTYQKWREGIFTKDQFVAKRVRIYACE